MSGAARIAPGADAAPASGRFTERFPEIGARADTARPGPPKADERDSLADGSAAIAAVGALSRPRRPATLANETRILNYLTAVANLGGKTPTLVEIGQLVGIGGQAAAAYIRDLAASGAITIAGTDDGGKIGLSYTIVSSGRSTVSQRVARGLPPAPERPAAEPDEILDPIRDWRADEIFGGRCFTDSAEAIGDRGSPGSQRSLVPNEMPSRDGR